MVPLPPAPTDTANDHPWCAFPPRTSWRTPAGARCDSTRLAKAPVRPSARSAAMPGVMTAPKPTSIRPSMACNSVAWYASPQWSVGGSDAQVPSGAPVATFHRPARRAVLQPCRAQRRGLSVFLCMDVRLGGAGSAVDLRRLSGKTRMSATLDWTALGVFVFFFGAVTIMGFAAARWRAGDLSLLHEWGLGGRRFGSFVTWFLLGGDLYTAYTLIAVPALVYAVGAYGFFAMPYTVFVYPIVFLVMPRLWNACRKHGWVTAADFVEGRYGSRALALAVAVTGVLATMPYIALQLVGLEVVFQAM